MVPSLATRTWAVKAGVVGTWLIWTGADQVRPPSDDLENAMPSRSPPLNLESCHTAYRAPLVRSTAISGMMSPVLTGSPVVGSLTPTVRSLSTMIGLDQVRP